MSMLTEYMERPRAWELQEEALYEAREHRKQDAHDAVFDDAMAGKGDLWDLVAWSNEQELAIFNAVREAVKGVMGHNRPEWFMATVMAAVRKEAEQLAEARAEEVD
jgi:hypothetical protein